MLLDKAHIERGGFLSLLRPLLFPARKVSSKSISEFDCCIFVRTNDGRIVCVCCCCDAASRVRG